MPFICVSVYSRMDVGRSIYDWNYYGGKSVHAYVLYSCFSGIDCCYNLAIFPYKQRFLNLGHDHYLLSAFGWDASRDALHYGFQHGIWCVGSGWALMLFPMLLPTGHNLAMIIVTFIMLSEHLENPQYPRWEINPRLKVVRYIIAQSKIKLMIKSR